MKQRPENKITFINYSLEENPTYFGQTPAQSTITGERLRLWKKWIVDWDSYTSLTFTERVSQIVRDEISRRYPERQEVRSLRAEIFKRLDEISEHLHATPIIRNTFIVDLANRKYSLAAPINIILEEYDDEVLARWPEVEAVGSGETETEAIVNLKNDVISLYKDLMGTSDAELGKLPKSWRRILKEIVKEK